MNTEQITVVAYLEVKAGSEEAFLREIPSLVAATRQEPACLNYYFHEAADNPALFMFYENWTSMAGLEEHARTAHIQAFRKNIADLMAKPTELKIFRMVSDPAG
jgi:quinol monooxygenase YgiN